MPHLPVQVEAIRTGEDADLGILLLVVAPSPMRPHAVIVNDTLRYPRRNGTQTRFLTESEVADLYRNRFAAQESESQRVETNRDEAIDELDLGDAVWVAVSGVPTGRGSLDVDEVNITETEQWAQRYRGRQPTTDFLSDAIPVARPGPRRFRLMSHYTAGSDARPNYLYAELHTDGSAVACHRLFVPTDPPPGEPVLIANTLLLWTVAADSISSSATRRERAHGESSSPNSPSLGARASSASSRCTDCTRLTVAEFSPTPR